MRRSLWVVLTFPLLAAAKGPEPVAVESTHFARIADPPRTRPQAFDEAAWRAHAEQTLRQEVERLEAALPRLREGYAAAREVVPLGDPLGVRQRLDLTGQGWAHLELSFRAAPDPSELDALRRAITQELKVRPLEKRRRPVRWILAGLGGAAVIGGAVTVLVRRRRRGALSAAR